MLPHVLLEQQAERCIKLAYQCQNRKAERFLRLLAVDLMLAAQMRKPPEAAKPERPAGSAAAAKSAAAKPGPDMPEEAARPADTAKEQAGPDVLSQLAMLSRRTRSNPAGAPAAAGTRLMPESASTA